MDLDLEKIHNILLAANLPSNIDDLKNPTEEFVVNLLNTFLRRFHIDVNTITKPTLEQQDIMSYCEDSDIIGLINLHIAMMQICGRIYVKDLCITDITSPGSKRLRKQAQFLANFILYANNKDLNIKDKVDEIQNRAKKLQDMLNQKNEIFESINNKALHNAKQLTLKEQYLSEIQNLQSKLEVNKKKFDELTGKVIAADERKKQAVERCGFYKTQASELDKTIAKLKTEIVESPEEYRTHLAELEAQQNSKVQEREILQEAFQDKKHMIEHQKSILNFVQEQLDKFAEVQDVHEQLKKITVTEDSTKKEVEALRTDITKFEKKLESQKDQRKEDKVDVRHAQYEDRLVPLRSLHTQLLSNKKMYKEKSEEVQIQYNENHLKLQKMQEMIRKFEEETVGLMKNYQELYDNEILTERTLWNTRESE